MVPGDYAVSDAPVADAAIPTTTIPSQDVQGLDRTSVLCAVGFLVDAVNGAWQMHERVWMRTLSGLAKLGQILAVDHEQTHHLDGNQNLAGPLLRSTRAVHLFSRFLRQIFAAPRFGRANSGQQPNVPVANLRRGLPLTSLR